MKHVIFLFLTSAMLLLSSCIDGEEDVYIEADGSARVKAVYRVPGVLFSAEDAEELKKNISEEIAEQEHLRLVTNRVDKKHGSRIITVEIETDDILALEGVLEEHIPGVNESKADKMLHALLGSITVRLDGLTADLSRDVELTPLLDEYLGKNSPTILGESQFRYNIHLPVAVESSNAHTVENGGRTLRWVYQLSECREKPISLNMVAKIPLPWWVYALIGLAGLVLIFIGYVLIRKLKRGNG